MKTRKRSVNTRKFGNRRFVLKWDSATFITYHDPSSVVGVAEKKKMAKVWLKDYNDVNWMAKMTAYRGGKDFKVWALPR
jgi:hypothetical protein